MKALALFSALICTVATHAATLTLSDFNSLDGSLKNSWISASSISSGILVVGAGAKDELGFEKTQNIDATSFGYLAITAKIDTGNESGIAVQFFNDNDLGEYTVNISSASFSNNFSTVYVPLNWANGSITDISSITSWNIGGGSTGSNNFRYSIDKVELATSAVPEPASAAMLGGLFALGYTVTRRRRTTR